MWFAKRKLLFSGTLSQPKPSQTVCKWILASKPTGRLGEGSLSGGGRKGALLKFQIRTQNLPPGWKKSPAEAYQAVTMSSVVRVLGREGSKLERRTRSQEEQFQPWLHYQGALQNLDKRGGGCQLHCEICLHFRECINIALMLFPLASLFPPLLALLCTK